MPVTNSFGRSHTGNASQRTSNVSYWDIVRIRLSGEAIQFLTSTGPFLAEPAKVWLLRRRGLSIKHAAAATVSEYLIYTFTSAALGIAGLTYLVSNFELSRPESVAAKVIVYVMGAFLLAATCAIIFRIYLIGAIIKGVSRLPLIGKHLRLEENDVRDTEDLLFVVLRDRPLRFLLILAVEFAAQALLVLELFVLLRTTGKPFSVLHPLLIEAATKFVGLGLLLHSRPGGRGRGHLRTSSSKRWGYLHPPVSLLLWRDGFAASSSPVSVWLSRHFGGTRRRAASQTNGMLDIHRRATLLAYQSV